MPKDISPFPRMNVRQNAIAVLNATLNLLYALGIRTSPLEVSKDFITKAVRFHAVGRVLMCGITAAAILAVREKCPGVEYIAIVAGLWTLFTIFKVCGVRLRKESTGPPHESNSRLRLIFVKEYDTYPVLTFVPDVVLLTLLAIHTGGAFSVFLPLFLVLCILADYAHCKSSWKRVFLFCFVLLPFGVVIFASTEAGRNVIHRLRVDAILHEPFWAPTAVVPPRMAIFGSIVYVVATLLGSLVLTNLLDVWIKSLKGAAAQEVATKTALVKPDPILKAERSG
jgi:hypothetical protein